MGTPEHAAHPKPKAPTGIDGFDEITGGGLPSGRTTLVEGGPGSGKTVMGLQTLVNGARLHGESGIFVAFEENSPGIVANAASFGWDLEALQRDKLFFLDAEPSQDLVQSGVFDLEGMLAALDAKVEEMGAKRIVFDALDVVLTLMPDAAGVRREAHRLHHWLQRRGLTAVLTAKSGHDLENAGIRPLGFMQFMVDCSVILNHQVVQGISQRNLRILKYRGTSFEENEAPFAIGAGGLEVAGTTVPDDLRPAAVQERVSTGVPRLDTMLDGGYFRASSVLITGFPGTAKTTLCGAFAEATCQRGERTLFVSFDSEAEEIVRNLRSVNIDLGRLRQQGLLQMVSARGIASNAEIHLMRIKNQALEHNATALVIDPISALAKSNTDTAHSVAERMIDWAKGHGITVVCTSLLEDSEPERAGTPLQISTIADTWIHLNYLVHAGERNRGLSVIKSRGTAHSNQVREMILGKGGVTLADAYIAGGEVLMGTLRWQREREERIAREREEAATRRQEEKLDTEVAELENRLKIVRSEIETKREEKAFLLRAAEFREQEFIRGREELKDLRKADQAAAGKDRTNSDE